MAMFGSPQKIPVNDAALAELAQAPRIKGPSLFGQGGAGRAIAGSIGDALMQMNGLRPIYAPAMDDQREAERRQQLLQQQRDMAWQDFQREYQFKRDNPMPKAPSEFDEALVAAGIDPASDEGRQLYELRARNMADPLRFVPGVDAQGNEVLRGVRSGSFGAPSGPPEGAIEMLRSNPSLAKDFDAKYGPGSSARVLSQGGAGPSVPRPFP